MIRSSLLALSSLAFLISAPALAQDEAAETPPPAAKTKEAPVEVDWTRIAKCRAILVCSFERRSSKHYSGMAGSTLWFRVKEVIRFESEPGLNKDGLWKLNFRLLRGRSQDLSAYRLLEWSLLYPARDKKAAARDAALCKRFPDTKQTFVLALPSTARLSTSGTVVRAKWGAIHAGTKEVLIAPLTKESRPAFEKALKDPARAPEHVPVVPKAPRAPKDPGDYPGGGRKGGGGRR
jgi:hypothetical protein